MLKSDFSFCHMLNPSNKNMVKLNIDLPKDFLKEEERCGHIVTTQMKEAWAVMIDILVEFQRICKKHNLTYYAIAGTLLGTIRHGGFIPWDDDIDVVMPRKDFDRFCKIAPSEFKHPYFFQSPFTDFGIDPGFAKIRRSDTTCLFHRDNDLIINYNQGIFIDVFPLDNIPDNPIDKTNLLDQLRIVGSKCRRSTAFYESKSKIKTLLKIIFFKLKKLFKAHWFEAKLSDYQHYEDLLKSFCDKDTKIVGNFSAGYVENWTWPRNLFESSKEVPFEFISIMIPSGYEKILDINFGNWKEFVKGGSCHGELFFDAHKPYTEYLKKQ